MEERRKRRIIIITATKTKGKIKKINRFQYLGESIQRNGWKNVIKERVIKMEVVPQLRKTLTTKGLKCRVKWRRRRRWGGEGRRNVRQE